MESAFTKTYERLSSIESFLGFQEEPKNDREKVLLEECRRLIEKLHAIEDRRKRYASISGSPLGLLRFTTFIATKFAKLADAPKVPRRFSLAHTAWLHRLNHPLLMFNSIAISVQGTKHDYRSGNHSPLNHAHMVHRILDVCRERSQPVHHEGNHVPTQMSRRNQIKQ